MISNMIGQLLEEIIEIEMSAREKAIYSMDFFNLTGNYLHLSCGLQSCQSSKGYQRIRGISRDSRFSRDFPEVIESEIFKQVEDR
jgi:hypothetical protein